MKKKTHTKKIHTKKPRLFSLAALCIALPISCAFAFSGCDTHTHVWGDWQRSETEHWRVCTECNEEERGAHTGEPCADCGYGFKALAFGFTEGGDAAHADFAREANEWFAAQGEENGFTYDFAGSDFSLLNDDTLAGYDMVIFLNDRRTSGRSRRRSSGSWRAAARGSASIPAHFPWWTARRRARDIGAE